MSERNDGGPAFPFEGGANNGIQPSSGNPEPVWDAADQKIMDVLGPIQRMLSDALPLIDALVAEIARLRADRDSWAEQASARVSDWDEMRAGRDRLCEALEAIAAYPYTRDQEMGVAAMRKIARAALQGESHES